MRRRLVRERRRAPHVSRSSEGCHATTHVNLDEHSIETCVETCWRPTMEAALNE
jgi:hypothetical protein